MFKQIDKILDSLFDIDLGIKRINIDYKSKHIARMEFFKLIKKFDPEHCYISQSDIRTLKKVLRKKYHNCKIIRYLMMMVSHVYTNPYENNIMKMKHDYLKYAELYEEFHNG